MLTNLIGNAIKFTEHGDVKLIVDVDSRTDSEAVLRFSVSDTGIGIPAERQQAIFKPFIQADDSTMRKYGGTGLGLTISASLAAAMGGRVWLESEVGTGSTFHFTVRFSVQKEAPAPVPGVPPPSLREGREGLRILLAEDNRVNQMVAARLLQKRGHTVVVVESGREAIAALDAGPAGAFDLVLMDVQMPDMDGLEATGIIRRREETASPAGHVPIIAMRAHAMTGDRERCLAAGMDGYVSKPIEAKGFFAAIDVLVPRDRGV